MRSEWPRKTIAECAANEPYATQIGPFGKALTPSEYTATGVPLLRGVNVNKGRFHDDDYVFVSEQTANRLAKFESFPGDVLLVHKGTLGKIGLMPTRPRFHRYIMGNSMLRVRCNPNIMLPEYLYYWLGSTHGTNYLLSRVSQVGVPQIQRPLTTLRECRLPVPPLPEQKAIAHILGTLDDKIELNRRMNQTLEAIAQALFKEWFIDPAQDGLPRGWREGCITDFASIRTETLNPGDRPSRTWEHYSIPAFDEGNSPAMDLGASIKSNKYKVPSTAVLVSKLNPATPRVWLPFIADPEAAICSTEFVPFVPHEPTQRPFVFELLRSGPIEEATAARATGTTGSRQRVAPVDIAAISCSIPPTQLLTKFSTTAGPIHGRVAANLHESRTLAQLRDTLLPKLLSGELRIKTAEKYMEARL